MCISVCPRGYLRNHKCDFHQFLCMLPMAVAQSSSGIVAISYGFPVLWMTSSFFYNEPHSGMTFAMKGRFCLNLLIYCRVGQEFNFQLLNSVILTIFKLLAN